MNLTKNFPLIDFLESQTARRHGIKEQFNPPKQVVDNLRLLSINILQPLRDHIKSPIIISSGWRSDKVNELTGGVRNSQHRLGLAADIYSTKISNARLFKIIQDLNLPYDQLIWEFGTKQEPAWVHVSWSAKPRKQILYIGV
jgi:zinc D-Ala-D-Ala carboxypeptidase